MIRKVNAVSVLSPEGTAAQVLEVVPAAMSAIRREMRRNRCCDVSVPQLRTLAFLDRAPGASLSDAADQIGLTLPAMSRLVDGLVMRRLVTRVIPAGNRRRVNLALTPRGRATLENSLEATQEYLAGQFDDLPVEDRATVVQAMEILGQIFAGERANRPGLAAARNGDPHGE